MSASPQRGRDVADTATRGVRSGSGSNNSSEATSSEGGKPNGVDERAHWHYVKDTLHQLQAGLGKWGEKEERLLDALVTRVNRVADEYRTSRGSVEARLERIENLLKAPPNPRSAAAPRGSWAAVAAGGLRDAGAPESAQPTRHTVRVQLAQAAGLNNENILKELKKTIPSAAAVRVLKSGDIDVTVPDEAAKDRAQGIPSTEDLKILRRDYQVEVPGVELRLVVASGKNADNNMLAQSICDGSRTLVPGLQITRINWLHSPKDHARRLSEGKTRGSLIVGFPTQNMQRRAIQGGLVVQDQAFEVRQFERGAVIQQCFKCQRWGHTQRACGGRIQCGQCAGPHQSQSCPEERVSCANCGKKHKAWERSICPTF